MTGDVIDSMASRMAIECEEKVRIFREAIMDNGNGIALSPLAIPYFEAYNIQY